MRNFGKGFLIGLAAVCIMALCWLFIIRPGIIRYEAQSLKAAYTKHTPGAGNSGGDLLSDPEEVETPVLDFAALQQAYPEVKAWLTIPGTAIDYPVAQSSIDDPEFYLRRNLNGQRRVAGTLFFQADCSIDGKSLIIYGHNMNDDTMFGGLSMYMDRIFFSEHSQIILQTLEGTRVYRVMAVLETDATRLPFNRTAFVDDEDFLSFVQCLKDEALISVEDGAAAPKQILLLVSCSYNWPDARYVVVAQRAG